MFKLTVLLGLILGVAAVKRQATKATPLAKVMTMLNSMRETSKKEIKEEKINFAAFRQWCEDTASEKNRLISEGTLQIEELIAASEEGRANAAQLGKEIEKLSSDIQGWEVDMKNTKAVRSEAKKTYIAAHIDYVESIDALERAVQVIKEAKGDLTKVKQAASLVQRVASGARVALPIRTRREMLSFAASPDEFVTKEGVFSKPEKLGYRGLDYKEPVSHGYDFNSNGVVDMLDKLLDKFVEEKRDIEAQEAEALKNFEKIMMDLEHEVEKAKQAINSKTSAKGMASQAAGNAEGELSEEKALLSSNTKYLGSMTAQCKTKNSEFKQRQKLRSEEIASLDQAIDVLQNVVGGHVEDYMPAEVTKDTASPAVPVLLQRSSYKHIETNTRLSPQQLRVSEYLQTAASRLKSKLLSALAVKVKLSTDPFDKVRKMIESLLARLQSEASEEMKHKSWCDKELKANDITRKLKAQEVSRLSSEIESATAKIEKLAAELAELDAALVKLDAEMTEAAEQRQKEKAVNEETLKDSVEAQQALAQAITILQEYYNKAGAPALLQIKKEETTAPEEDAPITWDEPYTGQLGSGGVVDMLQVIQTDFARLETETKADESAAAAAYSEFKTTSRLNKVAMEKDVRFKTLRKTQLTASKESKSSDLAAVQKELSAAQEYYAHLKPSCLDSSTTFEDRADKREDEIASLREALAILSGESMPPPPEATITKEPIAPTEPESEEPALLQRTVYRHGF
eukprot:GHVR01092118.1.p1 GENE.GHVR01092118.1~~GHVR01092118.1.p1  ORF type:complete len:743 (+),score=224.14 GHVR01092118.1:63-2291(+)